MSFIRNIPSLFTDEIEVARARWVDVLGFRVDVDLGWFVSLRHDEHPEVEIALTSASHESIPASHRRPAAGMALAFVVDSVDVMHRRLVDSGITVLQPPLDHPWGQRQVQAAIHDEVVLDLVELIEPDPAWMAANGFAPD